MGIFSRKSQPTPGPRTFDGTEGRDTLARLVTVFLDRVTAKEIEPVGDAAQQIFLAMPVDNPRAPVEADFLEARWTWIAAVAERASAEGDHALAGRIGLMTEIWVRLIIADDPRYQIGRLPTPELESELRIYRAAFRSLARMTGSDVLVPGGESGWTVSEALAQLSGMVEKMDRDGVPVGAELRSMAAGDSEALGLTQIESRPIPLGDVVDHSAVVERVHSLVMQNADESDRGDEASAAYLRGAAISMNGGDDTEAFAAFEQAAQLGHVQGMYDAGCIANRLGNTSVARHWWQLAAEAGHADSAWNLGAGLFASNGAEAARPWYIRAAELGDPRGYGALTQMARDADDDQALRHWSRLGAEAGEQFCMFFYGISVMRDPSRTPELVMDAIHFLDQAANYGDADAMFMLGLAHLEVGNRFDAGRWLRNADSAGNARAGEVLQSEGL